MIRFITIILIGLLLSVSSAYADDNLYFVCIISKMT